MDCDPQCNLTGMIFGFKGASDLEKLYQSPGGHNIRDSLAPAFQSQTVSIKAAECQSVPGQKNMFLLPGHSALAEFEVTLGIVTSCPALSLLFKKTCQVR